MADCSDAGFLNERKELIESPAMDKGPSTPDAGREIGDFPYDCMSPPTDVKKPAKVARFVCNVGMKLDPLSLAHPGSPRTPEEGVFDPFAPGPDDLALAPLCKKRVDGKRTIVARRLNFDASPEDMDCGGHDLDAEEESVSDQQLLESVYQNLLEVIISIQTEAFLAEMCDRQWDSERCRTPPFAPCTNGVAEACPAAPIKPSGKSRKIDLGLCKKLDF